VLCPHFCNFCINNNRTHVNSVEVLFLLQIGVGITIILKLSRMFSEIVSARSLWSEWVVGTCPSFLIWMSFNCLLTCRQPSCAKSFASSQDAQSGHCMCMGCRENLHMTSFITSFHRFKMQNYKNKTANPSAFLLLVFYFFSSFYEGSVMCS
jgi:hypothetical protein